MMDHLVIWLWLIGLISATPFFPNNRETNIFDFIIVGAGSAGSVLANRLSEDGVSRVLLLEAGGEPTIFNDIPLLCSTFVNGNLDWKYRTVPQETACFGSENRQALQPRGKVIGGTSEINCMLYVRGNRHDYNRWESLGNYNWSYAHVLPYFLKSEDNTNPLLSQDPMYHRSGGYLTVSDVPYHTPLTKAFLNAAEETGLPHRDLNGESQFGVMIHQATMRRGARCSSAKAFLRPALSRRNLRVISNAHVTKILFDDNKQVSGVTYDHSGMSRLARATKEVIISGGAINSPQILMLSGIGPRNHLESLGIPVIADVPGVGENFHDHMITHGLLWSVQIPINFVDTNSLLNLANGGMQYFLSGQGPLTSTSGMEGIAFIKTPFANQSLDWPDMQFETLALSRKTPYGETARKTMGFTKEIFDKYFVPALKHDGFNILPVLSSPKSRGHIRLKSANPYEHPAIDPKYFSHPEDLLKVVEGIKIALAFGNSDAFKKVGAKFYERLVPGCEAFAPRTDEYWTCLARMLSVSSFHPAGSCKMGPNSDPMAVVDPELRVRGVQGLRVADTSIFPVILTGNLNAPAIMVGEKASDIIKQAWGIRLH